MLKPRGLIVTLSLLPALAAGFMCSSRPCRAETAGDAARWIWSDNNDPGPANRFTYFRKVVDLPSLPHDAKLRFAADSNARLWVNGHLLRRKMARYHEEHITAEVVNAGPYLRTGRNVILVLHHNWGDLITFQRTGNRHAGLYLESSWVHSDDTWRWMQAAQFEPHDKQVVGVIGDRRIRYAQVIDGRKSTEDKLHDVALDDSGWKQAVIVEKGPWPTKPGDVETPGQREFASRPLSVIAAGKLEPQQAMSAEPLSIAPGIRTAKCQPQPEATREAGKLIAGQPLVITGRAGESRYVTFDFHLPVHGYPFLTLAEASEGVVVDFGYCEVARSIYSGKAFMGEDGWMNPEAVVGPGYADRYLTRSGMQSIEIPDERTARWLALHVHFKADGKIVIADTGIVHSQFPVRPVGSFSCGNELIDRIVKLCLIHAEVTMSDTYVDTPGREDGQWIEDARPRAQISERWFGDDSLRAIMIRTLAQGQFENGNLHPFAPSNFPVGPASYDWSVQWVAMLYDHYLWSGDTEIIQRFWPNLTKYWKLVLSLVDEQGIWRTNHLLADIRVGVRLDHAKQSSGVVTPWIIERLRWSATLAEAIGEGGQAGDWAAMADKMTAAFRKHHLVPAKDGVPLHVGDRLDPEHPELERGYSQAGQTVAVYSGLLNRDEARANIEYAFPAPDGSPPAGVTRWNNPTYGYRVLRAMSEVGLVDRAVAHLVERYAPYLPAHPRNPTPLLLQGPYGGPLPEYWVNREDMGLKPGELCTAQPADETGSHGWGSVPLLWLHDSLLGVRVLQPGGSKISIAPQSGGLPYVAGHTCTPRGTVWVYLDPQQCRLEVTIPADVRAEIYPPASWPRDRILVESLTNTLPNPGAGPFFVANQPGTTVLWVK